MPPLPNPESAPNDTDESTLAEVVNIADYQIAQASGSEITSSDVAHDDKFARSETPGDYQADLKKVEAAKSDQTAFEALTKEYMGIIRFVTSSYFMVGGDKNDVFQEAMLGFYKGVLSYDGTQSSFANFAKLCVIRQVITGVKTATRQKHKPLNEYVSFGQPPLGGEHQDEEVTLGDLLPSKGRSPEDIIIGREAFANLTHVIMNELSQLEYDVLNIIGSGQTYKVAATQLRVDEKVIDNAMQRVKRKLRPHIDEPK